MGTAAIRQGKQFKLFQTKTKSVYPFKKGDANNVIYLLRDEPDVISHHILTHGEWEQHLIDKAKVYLRPDANVIDAGANLGPWSIQLSKICPQGKVYSFEPQLEVFKQLCANLFLNGCTNVIPYNLGLGSRNESGQRLAMNINTFNNGASRFLDIPSEDGALVTTLDELKLPKISLIKMDIEGYELKALKGAEALLDRDRPVLFFEAWISQPQKMGELMHWLEAKKYRVQHLGGDDYYALPM